MNTLRPNAQRIRELREEAGLTQEDVAKGLGVVPDTVRRCEDSKPRRRIQRDILESMARLLSKVLSRAVTVEDIILPDGPPPHAENHWEHTALLMPAAGPTPDGLPTSLGVDSVLMVQVGGRPIIYWSLSYARKLGIKIVKIAVRTPGTSVEAFVKLVFPDLNVDFFVPDDVTRGPGYTVTALLRRLCSPAPPPGIDAALIVLGDTAFEFRLPPNSDQIPSRPPRACVLLSKAPDSHRWATYGGLARGGGSRPAFVEHGGTGDALIGVYYLNEIDRVCRCAEKLALASGAIEVTRLLNELTGQGYSIDPVQAGRWYDVGHEDMRFRAHQDLLQSGSRARVFHSLTFDTRLSVLRKGMNILDPQRMEALIDQIHYFTLLPAHYSSYFPHLLAFDDRWPGVDVGDGRGPNINGPWYEQGYVPFPSAAQLYVFGKLHPDTWGAIFAAIRHIRDDFALHWRPASREAIRQAYVMKTERRLDDLLEKIGQKPSSAPEDLKIQTLLTRQQLKIGGCKYDGLRAFLKARVYKEVDLIASRAERFTIISGDLCASNILVDLVTGMVKIIDPRGSFGGVKGVHGHALYDLAKLYHSWVARYDVIVNDLFELDTSSPYPVLKLAEPYQYTEVCKRFEDVFFDAPDIARDTLLVTALLFTSMIPLHEDSTRRQLAFLCQAINLFSEWA